MIQQQIPTFSIYAGVNLALHDVLKPGKTVSEFKDLALKIMEQTCKEFDMTTDELSSYTRKRDVVIPRQIAVFLMNLRDYESTFRVKPTYTNLTCNQIAELVGFTGRNRHCMVIHSYQTIIDAVSIEDPLIYEPLMRIAHYCGITEHMITLNLTHGKVSKKQRNAQSTQTIKRVHNN